MTKTLATAALAGCLVLAPIVAEASAWTPDLDTVIADPTVEAIFFDGDVILDGVAPFLTAIGSSAAAEPAYVFLDGGPQPGFEPSYLLTVEDADSNVILAGSSAYAHAREGWIEWGFYVSTDATGLFGKHVMAFASVDPAVGDALASGADAWTTLPSFAITAVSEVPVPAALPLLATALVGLAVARRRAARRGAARAA